MRRQTITSVLALLLAGGCAPSGEDGASPSLGTAQLPVGTQDDVLESKADAEFELEDATAEEEEDVGKVIPDAGSSDVDKGDVVLSLDLPGGESKDTGDTLEDVGDGEGKPAIGDGGTSGTIDDAIEGPNVDAKDPVADVTKVDVPPTLCEGPADCDDGDPCNGAEGCDPATGCLSGTPLVCDDGNVCNGVETCIEGAGCSAGTELSCDDGDPCNGVETCDAASGCVDGTPLECDDGLWCNGLETCLAGVGCQDGEDVECDNLDPCDGLETCNEDADECAEGIDKDCDDGKVCTNDSCMTGTGVCEHDVDVGLCGCSGTPMTVSYDQSFSLGEASVACPLIGGTAGIGTELAFSGSYAEPHCNNECQSELSLTGSLSGTVSLCKESLTATGAANYTGSATGCLDCNPDNCKQFCGDGSCETSSFTGSASLTYSRFFGYHMKHKKGPVGFEVKCGATLSGTPSVSATGSKTTDNESCTDCVECLSGNASLAFGVGGSVGCYMGFDLWDGLYERQLGCQSCGSLGVDIWGGGGGQSGECGGGLCSFAGVGVNAGTNSPCVGFAIGWFGASVQCSASASACAEASNCSSGSGKCKGGSATSTSVSCNVSYSGDCK